MLLSVGRFGLSMLRRASCHRARIAAVTQRKPESVTHHPDQGSQYTTVAFGRRCKEMSGRPSMGISRRLLRQRPSRQIASQSPAGSLLKGSKTGTVHETGELHDGHFSVAFFGKSQD